MIRFALLVSLPLLTVACDQPAAIADCEDCAGDERGAGMGGSDSNMEAPQSQCGNVWYVDMVVKGQLTDVDGKPLNNADVWLEERAWSPTSVHGEGKTRGGGYFEFEVKDVPIIEECWGWAALFNVVGEHGYAYGEIDANMQVVRAWQDDTFIADVSNLPFVLAE